MRDAGHCGTTRFQSNSVDRVVASTVACTLGVGFGGLDYDEGVADWLLVGSISRLFAVRCTASLRYRIGRWLIGKAVCFMDGSERGIWLESLSAAGIITAPQAVMPLTRFL